MLARGARAGAQASRALGIGIYYSRRPEEAALVCLYHQAVAVEEAAVVEEAEGRPRTLPRRSMKKCPTAGWRSSYQEGYGSQWV